MIFCFSWICIFFNSTFFISLFQKSGEGIYPRPTDLHNYFFDIFYMGKGYTLSPLAFIITLNTFHFLVSIIKPERKSKRNAPNSFA